MVDAFQAFALRGNGQRTGEVVALQVGGPPLRLVQPPDTGKRLLEHGVSRVSRMIHGYRMQGGLLQCDVLSCLLPECVAGVVAGDPVVGQTVIALKCFYRVARRGAKIPVRVQRVAVEVLVAELGEFALQGPDFFAMIALPQGDDVLVRALANGYQGLLDIWVVRGFGWIEIGVANLGVRAIDAAARVGSS